MFLMHPKEFKQEKAGTGRLTALSLAGSMIEMGVGFDDHPAVNTLIDDPGSFPVLLYPAAGAMNVSQGGLPIESLGGRQLVVFVIDATWACAKKMLTQSTRLQALPKLMFTPVEKSRFVIKRQPHEWCLSTLEATHQLLGALESAGLDSYPDPAALPALFQKMQDFQIACASDPLRTGYRRKAISLPKRGHPKPHPGKGREIYSGGQPTPDSEISFDVFLSPAYFRSMQTRTLGKNGPVVSAIGLGCMGMSDFYGPSDDAVSEALLMQAFDRGVTFFDTADMYGVGANESLVGRSLRGVRDKVVLATKFGNMRRIDGAHLGINGRPEYVKAACEQSLKRLGVDHIDLYYQHRVDPSVPIEETVGAMADLVKQGKVKWLGLSEAGPATIRRAHKTHPISALQTELSLWTRDAQGEILTTLRELGIGFVAYSPLGRGFLTGAFKKTSDFVSGDFRSVNPRMTGDNFDANLKLVHAVEAMAKDKNISPAQLALAWVLAQGSDIVPIPGTRRLKYLEDNLGAASVTLSAEELSKLSSLVPPDAVAGTRYDEAGMKRLGI